MKTGQSWVKFWTRLITTVLRSAEICHKSGKWLCIVIDSIRRWRLFTRSLFSQRITNFTELNPDGHQGMNEVRFGTQNGLVLNIVLRHQNILISDPSLTGGHLEIQFWEIWIKIKQ